MNSLSAMTKKELLQKVNQIISDSISKDYAHTKVRDLINSAMVHGDVEPNIGREVYAEVIDRITGPPMNI